MRGDEAEAQGVSWAGGVKEGRGGNARPTRPTRLNEEGKRKMGFSFYEILKSNSKRGFEKEIQKGFEPKERKKVVFHLC